MFRVIPDRRWDAWRLTCLAWAKSSKYRDRVERTRERIEAWRQDYTLGVSLSGGKDSLVMLHLAQPAPAYFSDSGAELPQTYEVMDRLRAAGYTIHHLHPEVDLVEIYRRYGALGNMEREADWPDKAITGTQLMRHILLDPLRESMHADGITMALVGLRAQESDGRSWVLRHGIWQRWDDYQRLNVGYPILDWSVMDVWAYIFQYDLPYNDYYRMCTTPPERSRIGSVIGTTSIRYGRMARLRHDAPAIFQHWAKIFPNMRWF